MASSLNCNTFFIFFLLASLKKSFSSNKSEYLMNLYLYLDFYIPWKHISFHKGECNWEVKEDGTFPPMNYAWYIWRGKFEDRVRCLQLSSSDNKGELIIELMQQQSFWKSSLCREHHLLRWEHGKIVSSLLERKDENNMKSQVPIENEFKNLGQMLWHQALL